MRSKHLLKSVLSVIAAVLLSGYSFSAYAQQTAIRGTITDDSGQPVLGAAVMVPGTTIGTTSDIDGHFSLTVSRGTTLEISCIGYSTEMVIVGPETNYSIVLHEDAEFLDETVVIGYSVQKKSDITGAIASVKSSDLSNRSTSNTGAALQGKLAGLQVFTASAAPGASTTFRIRGYSSTSGSSNPLYLVDGLTVSNINFLDPENIESIEVLKDAASAAIYGAQAGNGVVLITTKKGGDRGTSRVFYNNQITFTSQSKKVEMMNAAHFKDYWRTAGKVTEDAVFGTADTDWQDVMLETGFMQKHTVGVQAANNNGNFYVALSYLDNNGIVVGDKDIDKRMTLQVNADYKIKPWLKVGTTNSIERGTNKSISEQSSNSGASRAIFYYDPTVPVEYASNDDAPASLIAAMNDGNTVFYGPNGNLRGVSMLMTAYIYNPSIALDMNQNQSWRTNVNGTLYADFTPIKNLVYTSKLGYRIASNYYNNYSSPYYLTPKQVSAAPSMSSGNTNTFYYQWENYVNYNKAFGRHSLSVMAGMQYADNRSESVSGTTNELTSLEENYRYLDYTVSTATVRDLGGTHGSRRTLSYFGRLGYVYDNRYMLQVNFRADAFDSSKLSKTNRWGYFPSVSAGWTVTNEPFMREVGKNTLSFLKIRASWGINGNINSLNNYPYTSSMNMSTYYNFDNSGLVLGALPSTTLANPSLTWEESRQVDAGVDARFFNNKLTLTYDYYYKRTTGMLGTISAPYISGCTTQSVNAGKIDNWGHELELSWKESLGDFSYGIDANFSTVTNIVRESPYESDRYTSGNANLEAGYPMWYLRLYDIDHIDENGINIYKEGETEGPSADGRVAYTNIYPKLTYGLTLTARWKNLDLSIFGSGVYGNDKLLNVYWTAEPMVNMPEFVYRDTWAPGKTDAKYGMPVSTDTKYEFSSQWLFHASYFKIKQIQFGYSLPSHLLKKVYVSSLRVFCSLDDFFLFTKYPGDPESRSNFGASMAVDNIAYPMTKKLMFGVNLSF